MLNAVWSEKSVSTDKVSLGVILHEQATAGCRSSRDFLQLHMHYDIEVLPESIFLYNLGALQERESKCPNFFGLRTELADYVMHRSLLIGGTLKLKSSAGAS